MEKTYDDIIEMLKTHINPKLSPIIQTFKFNTRDYLAGESLANYVAEHRVLGEYCMLFWDNHIIEDMIRDRLVCGINDHGIQRRLLQEGNLTDLPEWVQHSTSYGNCILLLMEPTL